MLLKKKITVDHKFLNLPVSRDATMLYMTLRIDETIVHQFEIGLSVGTPDFWVFTDLVVHKGKQLTLEVESDNESILDSVALSDEIIGADSLYAERYRPQFHFSSMRGWLNDPNGLLYYQGAYHLFYQHNPHGIKWGNMHWGHAIGTDLVHWEELGDKLLPDETGTMFSGSGVVDWHNTAGFQTGETPAQVLIYTAAGDTSQASKGKPFTVCLAYSNDNGVTWTKFHGNPVLDEISGNNRDPKVFWYEPDQKWIMALYLGKGRYTLLSSPDIKHWTRLCDIEMPGCSECPDFFELPVDGDPMKKKWIFWAATRGAYMIGSFDGVRFIPESGIQYTVAEGGQSYAAQTWNDIPSEDGRRLQITWANFDIPDMPFNSFMTFPCALTLRTVHSGLRLFVYPVEEIEKIYGVKYTYTDIMISDEVKLPSIRHGLLDIDAEFTVGSAGILGFHIYGTSVAYNIIEKTLLCGSLACPMEPDEGKIRLRILVDRTSIEIFGNCGDVYIPVGLIHINPDNGISVFAEGGSCIADFINIHELESIWKNSR